MFLINIRVFKVVKFPDDCWYKNVKSARINLGTFTEEQRFVLSNFKDKNSIRFF